MSRANLYGMTSQEISGLLSTINIRTYIPPEIAKWLYQKRVYEPEIWTNLPKPLRQFLKENFTITIPIISSKLFSKDGVIKYLFSLNDRVIIESVFIPDGKRKTLCISSQAGCALGCKFCLTAKIGLIRNLKASEIAGQVSVLMDDLHLTPGNFNIVFMGMGEPLANIKELKSALTILTSEEGMQISPRHITISTSGLMDELKEIAELKYPPNIAISIGAADDAKRNELMPLAKIYSLKEIREFLLAFPIPKRRRISIEYTMLKGVNDSNEDALSLIRFCKGLKCKINLIPFNEAPELPFNTPDSSTMLSFQEILCSNNIQANMRKSRGRDILAACGQLAGKRRPETNG